LDGKLNPETSTHQRLSAHLNSQDTSTYCTGSVDYQW